MNAPGESLGLHRFAILTAVATFFLIIAGALVVGHEAGLAVPDWPLSYGTWMPPMEGNIFYEHGHRMVATTVGLLTIVLVIWLWRAEPRRWVRRVGLAALLAVVAQGILGGITVLYLLPTSIVVSHACLAQIFFCMTIGLAVFTSPGWNRLQPPVAPMPDGLPTFRNLCAITTAAVFLQLLLGAALRHKGLSLTPHLAGAGVVSVLTAWLVLRTRTALSCFRMLRRLSLAAGGLLVLQLGLGLASYWVRRATQGAVQPESAAIWITTAHVATGALLLGDSWILTLWAFGRLAVPGTVLAFMERPQRAEA